MQKWEYAKLRDADLDPDILNRLGEQGWDLVTIYATHQVVEMPGGRPELLPASPVWVFKRPKED